MELFTTASAEAKEGFVGCFLGMELVCWSVHPWREKVILPVMNAVDMEPSSACAIREILNLRVLDDGLHWSQACV